MKKKWLKRVFLMMAVSAIALSAAGCTEKGDGSDTGNNVSFEIDESASVYETTLNEVPGSWNPHTWYNADDMVVLEYVVTPLVANIADEEGNISYVPMAATAVTDITADFADKDKWGIEGEEGYVFQIDLNSKLTWEDGTKINAQTYIESMQTLLRSDMSNFRAGRYSAGAESIRNAGGYVNNDKAGQNFYANAVDVDFDESATLYFNPSAPCYFLGNDSMEKYYSEGLDIYFYNEDDVNLYEKFTSQDGYIEITDEYIQDLTVLSENFGDFNPEAWIEFCFVIDGVYEDVAWEDVGLYAIDDYRLIMIMEYPMEIEAFYTLLKRNWIVNEAAYSKDMEKDGAYVTTRYNTAEGKTMSFGPYKVVNANLLDAITLEKNENWYGWNEGDYTGLYTYEEFGDYDYVRVKMPGTYAPRLDSIPLNETSAFPVAYEAENAFGEVVTDKDLGEKELFFVHLWATWCGPCVQEMDELAEIANLYGDRVGFIGLCSDLDENASGAARLAEKHNIPFDSIYAGTEGLERLLEMVSSGYVPTTILIDGQGNIIGEQIVGNYGMGYCEFIDDALESLGN